MHFLGAVWILANFDPLQHLVPNTAHGAHSSVVFVDYHRTPASRSRVSIDEADAATKYVADHGDEFTLDTARLAIARDGVSRERGAGSLFAEERSGPTSSFPARSDAVADTNFEDGGYNDCAYGPWYEMVPERVLAQYSEAPGPAHLSAMGPIVPVTLKSIHDERNIWVISIRSVLAAIHCLTTTSSSSGSSAPIARTPAR
jgi:hypothetical protein